MEEKKKAFRAVHFLVEIAVLVLVATGVYVTGLLRQAVREDMIRNLVMSIAGIGVVCHLIRQGCMKGVLDYDNSRHPARFWLSFFICSLAALACVWLPAGGWPFVAIYVTLSLFSSGLTGITAATILLMISVLLQEGNIGVFMMYFLSGLLGSAFFSELDSGFKVAIPTWISMMVLMVCETANIILFANEQLNMEMFVIPVANVLINGILLIGILKLFSSIVIYRYRLKYLELTDPECRLLLDFKEKARQEYYQCMHTAYFCDRIARKLGLDAEASKTAGYYHKIESMLSSPKEKEPLLAPYKFPPKVMDILKEYWGEERVGLKETAVLIFADGVTASVMYLFSKEKDSVPDYDKIIDVVFRKILDSQRLNHCEISLEEINLIKNIFKEEKLYYDFLR